MISFPYPHSQDGEFSNPKRWRRWFSPQCPVSQISNNIIDAIEEFSDGKSFVLTSWIDGRFYRTLAVRVYDTVRVSSS
jgi:hypothetical protein